MTLPQHLFSFLKLSPLHVGLRRPYNSYETKIDFPWSSTSYSNSSNCVVCTGNKGYFQTNNDKVISAIEYLGHENIMAGDVSSHTGLSIFQAQKSLTHLYILTHGNLRVTTSGHVLYSFPLNLKTIILKKSMKNRLGNLCKKYSSLLSYIIRISFGVVLFISIFMVVNSILMISNISSSEEEKKKDSIHSFRDKRMFNACYNLNHIFNFSYPKKMVYSHFYNPCNNTFTRTTMCHEMKEEPNIFECIFNYIFGDIDYNSSHKTTQLRNAANMIRLNDCLVTAEQLAPFCTPPDPSLVSSSEESFVLDILEYFRGEPMVTNDGDVLYYFPELGLNNSSESLLFKLAGLPAKCSNFDIIKHLRKYNVPLNYFRERSELLEILRTIVSHENSQDITLETPLKFNKQSTSLNIRACLLTLINYILIIHLGSIILQHKTTLMSSSSYYTILLRLYPMLKIYGYSMIIIPILRYIHILYENQQIYKRNLSRQKWMNILKDKGERIKRKLEAAKSLKNENRKSQQNNLTNFMYESDKGIEYSERKSEKKYQKEFWKLLDGYCNVDYLSLDPLTDRYLS